MRFAEVLIVASAFVLLMGAGLDAGRYLAAGSAVSRAASRGAEAASLGLDPWDEVVRSLADDGLDPANMALVMDVRDNGRRGRRVDAVGVVYRPEGPLLSSLSALLRPGAVDVRSFQPTGAAGEM